ncbi:MAG: hypothetical protein A2113_02465 [Candidatus Woykebacteria bacterium GWA1_44_8]|uniref:Uncharacterized protein n=1 Tax=Candidatus Woykebacteria bacterium GWA1_44_8 TaxID=1802591 RepID=A0A1G1W311_9BACT|nr:MAG: hypothetical protein A2113_02465 [Candidatus Woykebacteria bacterium GWA1_44_8]
MPKLTAANTTVLPTKRSYQAPSCWNEEKLWFERRSYDPNLERLDRDCIRALIAKGTGTRECPTVAEWAAFCVAGGVIATLTGKYITPPDPEPLDWAAEARHFIWEALWQAAEENGNKLDREFLAVILREFLTREHYAPPDRPYFRSSFEEMWRSHEYPDAMMHSIGNVRVKHLREGRKAFKQLPSGMQEAIERVAKHVPTMLPIANRRIRKTYHY